MLVTPCRFPEAKVRQCLFGLVERPAEAILRKPAWSSKDDCVLGELALRRQSMQKAASFCKRASETVMDRIVGRKR
jgi:hypothetical protein